MPRRGWQAIEVPSGWYEVIRGPRPPSQKWPRASPTHSAQSGQPLAGSSPPSRPVVGRWGHRRGVGRVGQSGQPERARSSPEVAISAARQRVVQLEAALAALWETQGPETTMLQTSLKRAKQAAQEPPFGRADQFVRAVRQQGPTTSDGARRGEEPSGVRVGRRRGASCKVARGSKQPRRFLYHRPLFSQSAEHRSPISRRW